MGIAVTELALFLIFPWFDPPASATSQACGASLRWLRSPGGEGGASPAVPRIALRPDGAPTTVAKPTVLLRI